jgi:hypothetical protein
MATLSMSSMTTMTGSGNNNNCVLPILDLQSPSVTLKNEKLRVSSHNQFYSNNTSIGNLGTYNNYFGTGIDGDVTISSSAQISSSTSPAGLNNTIYGDPIVKNYTNLTINVGILFSPLRPCRGLIIYCTGNLTVNGTISMTGKGGGVGNKIAAPLGVAPVTEARYDLIDATIYVNNVSSSAYRVGGRGIPTHWNWAPSGSAWFSNYKIRAAILSGSVAGGSGGVAAPAGNPGQPGSAGVNCCGGGGGGSAGSSYNGAVGGRGTIFTGGGGGGQSTGPSISGGPGSNATFEVGGAGTLTPTGGQGGVGTPNGATGAPSTASPTSGVGGLLIIIVRGNVTINGTVSNNGSTSTGGGGGSGGGRTVILYGGTYTNLGTVSVIGGTTPGAGGSGGAGALTVRKIQI